MLYKSINIKLHIAWIRIRQPGRIFHLGPHIDSGNFLFNLLFLTFFFFFVLVFNILLTIYFNVNLGGIDRWYNEEYRKVYDKIFEGKVCSGSDLVTSFARYIKG